MDLKKLPYEEITGFAGRTYMRKESSALTSRHLYWIPFLEIEIRPKFNRRVDYGDIKALADSMAVNGVEPLTVDVTDTHAVYLHKGHRRLSGLDLLIKAGRLTENLPGIKVAEDGAIYIECFVNKNTVTEQDRLLSQVYENDGKGLTFMEVVDVFRVAKESFGLTTQDISKKVPKYSRQSVDNMMLILALDNPYVYKAIEAGITTPTAAVALIRKLNSDSMKVANYLIEAMKENRIIKVKEVEGLVVKVEEPEAEEAPAKQYEDGWKPVGTSDKGSTTVVQQPAVPVASPAPEPPVEEEAPAAPLPQPGRSEELKEKLADAKQEFANSLDKPVVNLPYDGTAEDKSHTTSSRPTGSNPDKEFEKLNEIKDETILCTDVITTLDKIATMVKRLPGNEVDLNEIDRLIHFSQNKLTTIKEFVIKAEIR